MTRRDIFGLKMIIDDLVTSKPSGRSRILGVRRALHLENARGQPKVVARVSRVARDQLCPASRHSKNAWMAR